MTNLSQLYERREQLRAEIKRLDAALTLLRCSYCGADMLHLPGHDVSTHLSGEDMGRNTHQSRFTCPNCRQSVRLTQILYSERANGEWVSELEVSVKIIEQGKPFVFKPELDTLWIED